RRALGAHGGQRRGGGVLGGEPQPRRSVPGTDRTCRRGRGMGGQMMTTAHQGLPVRARPRPASALSAVGTLAWRAMLKIKHVPFQLFDVTVMPIMFPLSFTTSFAERPP